MAKFILPNSNGNFTKQSYLGTLEFMKLFYIGERYVVCSTVGPNSKNPPKIRFQKFVKINMTNFEYKTYPLETKKGATLLKFAWKN